MDPLLVEYLNSGEAWVFVGSGPSVEIGVPKWSELADCALKLCEAEGGARAHQRARESLEAENYPQVFERVAAEVGLPRLIAELRPTLDPRQVPGQMYRAIARWPARNYLTTNYDDELSRQLVREGEAYQTLSNSADHMGLLTSDASGFVVKLHGDLSTTAGLVLTSSHYNELQSAPDWRYWRDKLGAIFGMCRVVVVGYSLRDPHIRAVLEAAKIGSSVAQPVCWLAPEVSQSERREYLEKYRIRVVAYPSEPADHVALANLVRGISLFIPSRPTVRIRQEVATTVAKGTSDQAATAVFVFNRLEPHVDLLKLRIDVALASLEAHFEELQKLGQFDVRRALELVGWTSLADDESFCRDLAKRARDSGLFVKAGTAWKTPDRLARVERNRLRFDAMRGRFRQSVALRIRRDYPNLDETVAAVLATDLDEALTGFFRRGGLTLATLVFSNSKIARSAPNSIVAFISEASNRYDDLKLRLAFWHAAVTSFVEAGAAEREYLGRLAQGFFAFHALGTFGESAIERTKNAQATVWLLDSNVQIPALAVGAPSRQAYVDALERLRGNHVRLFTSRRLFDETVEHLTWAHQLIERFGTDSPYVIQSATGAAPYRRRNEFLQGFIRWQAAGNESDWPSYVFACTGKRSPSREAVERTLATLGVEVVDFDAWPGFNTEDFATREDYEVQIKEMMRRFRELVPGMDPVFEKDLERKVPPEAEAAVIVLRLRSDDYQVLTPQTDAWFVSSTSVVNAVGKQDRITWQPEAFLAFVGTLLNSDSSPSSDRAFEVVLWSLSEAGINPIPESTIEHAFKGVIDESSLTITEQRDVYRDGLGHKYGEAPDAVIARMAPSKRVMAAIQMSSELAQVQAARADTAEGREAAERKRAVEAERSVTELEKYRRRLNTRKGVARKRLRTKGPGKRKP